MTVLRLSPPTSFEQPRGEHGGGGLVRPSPLRSWYAVAAVVVGVAVFAFVWFFLFSTPTGIFASVRSVGRDLTYDMGSNSSTYDMTDSFFVNLANYFLVLVVLGLILSGWVYTHRKRGEEALGY